MERGGLFTTSIFYPYPTAGNLFHCLLFAFPNHQF